MGVFECIHNLSLGYVEAKWSVKNNNMDLYQIQVTDSTIEGGSGVEKTDEASLSEEKCDLQYK